MKSKILFLFLLFCGKAFSYYSLVLINDSPFELTAFVQSANGMALGQLSLQRGEQSNWQSTLSSTELQDPGSPEVSLTPFVVIWKCSHGGVYSICEQVSPGATATANSCSGMKYCPPAKKKKEKTQEF